MLAVGLLDGALRFFTSGGAQKYKDRQLPGGRAPGCGGGAMRLQHITVGHGHHITVGNGTVAQTPAGAACAIAEKRLEAWLGYSLASQCHPLRGPPEPGVLWRGLPAGGRH